ncbi:flavoprotein [Saccharopolyspora mangrovi]|uniref:Flavoprotein n=1 Tax=Saccharopolyspora mangrovi TaxID=3082379 RepID=A0ABU6ABI0_9PSEU|nr:flavoprotein [Saccharopolyspora sp. S2-29]MEB3368901.1 flavoprotein [Saccharopolyspora sp. S2-29]
MNPTAPCSYLVVCAAPPVLRIEELITSLQADGWNVVVIATPMAATWIDLDAVSRNTGCLTRVHAEPPQQRDSLPRADAVVAAPLTFNSVNKWAAGINDTLALGVLNEMLGADVPILAVPCVKSVLRKHPAYDESIRRLTGCGVSLLDPDAVTVRADDGLATFAWPQITAALSELNGT